eukprot:TRINITY_DN2699_c0_g1_i2.p1 TRINITY_DN2699_c0_g1~~TRINITY_DN2699_c0_g1_i2.p1  ORF type:complete len:445 (+),score=79.21 TRINITY_DN2699_c0_g1_i2:55-1389(+)
MSSKDVETLKSMGFAEKSVRTALRNFPNFDEALEFLLNNPEGVETNNQDSLPVTRENIIEYDNQNYPHLVNWVNSNYVVISGVNNCELGNTDHYSYWAPARGTVKIGRGGEKSLSTGSWYFEVTLNMLKSCRIGWCIPTFAPSRETKLGDGSDSWAVDGTKMKKYYQGKEEAYNQDWAKNDVIGTMVDFDSNKIYYSVNGHKLECVFTNVTADQLYPCFSVHSRSKITVNFGPNFRFAPKGAMGLNSCLTPENQKKLEILYDKYAEENGIIQGGNTLVFLRDMGATGATHPVVGVVAWRMNAGKLLTITKEEWMCTWALTQSYDFESMKKTVNTWLEESTDKRCFSNYYNYLFKYLKLASPSLNPTSAIRGWLLCGIDKKWKLWAVWKEHVETKKENITLTTWNQLLNFISEIGDDPLKYDPEDTWPTYLADFAETKLLQKDKH